jgi:hypothetical protein
MKTFKWAARTRRISAVLSPHVKHRTKQIPWDLK